MRLLITTDTVGGVWDYTATLTRQLVARGHTVYLAIIGHATDEQIAQLPEDIVIESYDHRLEWMRASAVELRATAEWLAQMARLWRVDVVHLNQMAYSGLIDFSVPTVVVVHSDTCSWFQEVLGEPLPPEWEEYRTLVVAGIAAADVVIAPTRYQADMTLRCLKRSVDLVIHNGVDPPKNAAGANPRVPLLLSAGRAWDEAKAMGLYDQAVEMLGAAATPAYLLGSIEGPDGTFFEASSVTCLGRVSADEAADWMSRATVYVGASLYEPFGLAPVEAAMRGCALLLSDIGSFRELWEGAAHFFPANDASALAAAIGDLNRDPERVAELGNAARSRALERYSSDHFCERYLRLYSSLLDSHPASGAVPTEAPVTPAN